MILVHAPLKRDYIVSLLDGKTIEGMTFKLEKRDQMKLFFQVDGDAELAAKVVKKTIKASEFGQALFFNVSVV